MKASAKRRAVSSSMRSGACETTIICVFFPAARISLARGGSRSKCRLVSGSFSTISSGGRGVRRAATHKRYLSVPSDNSAEESDRSSPCCCTCRSKRPFCTCTESRLRGKASSRVVARASSDRISILNQIYEVDFKGFSYGFRPGRRPHQALDALTVGI